VRAEGYSKIIYGGKLLDVLNLTVRMSANATCEIYKSCNKVEETTMMASNGQGFLQFLVKIRHIIFKG
jgi:hypothetical protein